MKLLVTGTRGQVVTALLEKSGEDGLEIIAAGRPELDLLDSASIEAVLARTAPDLVVNAAAYTAVDKAESEPDLAMRLNAEGAGYVARASAALGVPVIQLSTDYVFDGTSPRPYREDDPTGPTSTYGRSKLAGEREVAAANPRHVILRTAWVYSAVGQNFVKTMLRLGETREEVGVVAYQHGAPTYAPDIADAVVRIAKTLMMRRGDVSLFGIFHLVGGGEATWAEFADAIFALAAQRGRRRVRVKPIGTADYPTPARRPANSRLDTHKLAEIYGIILPPWQESLAACMARLLSPSTLPSSAQQQ